MLRRRKLPSLRLKLHRCPRLNGYLNFLYFLLSIVRLTPRTNRQYSRKKDSDNEHGGQGTISRPNRPTTTGDSRSAKENASARNPVSYATWGSSSKSAIVPASPNDLNNGYGTIRKANKSFNGSASPAPRPATDSVTYVTPIVPLPSCRCADSILLSVSHLLRS